MCKPKQQCDNYYPTDFDLEHLTHECSECGAPVEEGQYYCSRDCHNASQL